MNTDTLLKVLATKDTVPQANREQALQVILDKMEPAVNPKWYNLEVVANFLYSLLLSGNISQKDIDLNQIILDEYTRLTIQLSESNFRPINIGTAEDPVYVPHVLFTEIDKLVRTTCKIQAIKMVREHFVHNVGFGKMGLKEAKDTVEKYMEINHIPYPAPKTDTLQENRCKDCDDPSCPADRSDNPNGQMDRPDHRLGFD